MAALIETPDPPRDEQAWSQLARMLPAGLCLLHVHEDGTLQADAVNSGLAALLHATSATPTFEGERFVDPADRHRLISLLREQGHAFDCLARLRRDDGGTVWVEMSAAAVPLPGDSLRVALLVRDVGISATSVAICVTTAGSIP
jgi:hypothetical protein